MRDFSKKAVEFLGSFHLACVLFVLLLVLTFLGTWEQQTMSLYDVQVKYFESLILVYEIGGEVPLPLPGGYLLLSILLVNIVVGGLIRIRKGTATVGVLIAHSGIVLLLAGSFVEDQFKTEGRLTLFEGEKGAEYWSLHKWEVVVTAPTRRGGVVEYVVPDEHFTGLETGQRMRYRSAELPFDLVLSGYARNSSPVPARPGDAGIDGYKLRPRDPIGAEQDRGNWPGLIATVVAADAADSAQAILWGRQTQPWPVTVAGTRYLVDLRRKTWQLPFTIHLRDFVHKLHPGTKKAKEFSSYVTKIQNGVAQDIHITMNEPFRYEGYTLYQTAWDRKETPSGPIFSSTFSVVNNPSDQVPLIACLVIAFGLLWQFLRKIYLYMMAEGARATRRALVAGRES